MKRLIVLAALVPLVIYGVAAAVAAPKVFVCKYVGTPGVNETLQTGQNPISVSSNAIPNYQGVGSSFADAQGRSFVIAEDTGQAEPTCPAGQTPPPPPVVPPVVPPVITTPPVTTTTTSTMTTPAPEEEVIQPFVGK